MRVSGDGVGDGTEIRSPRLGLVVVPSQPQLSDPVEPEQPPQQSEPDPPPSPSEPNPIDEPPASIVVPGTNPATVAEPAANVSPSNITTVVSARQTQPIGPNRSLQSVVARSVTYGEFEEIRRHNDETFRSTQLLIELIDEESTQQSFALTGSTSELLASVEGRVFEPGSYRIQFFGESIQIEQLQNGVLSEQNREVLRELILGVSDVDKAKAATPNEDAGNELSSENADATENQTDEKQSDGKDRTASKDREMSQSDEAWRDSDEIIRRLMLSAT